MKRGTQDHPKTLRLMEELHCSKPEACGLLELLWQFTARFAPRGDIGRWTDESIVKGVEWERNDYAIVPALVISGFLDSDKKHRLLVHDWPTHCDQGVRKFISRSNLTFAEPSGRRPDTVRTVSRHVRTRDEPPFPFPIPVPIPVPVQTETTDTVADAPETGEPVASGKAEVVPTNGTALAKVPPPQVVFTYWREQTGRKDARFTEKRRALIAARLREGYTVENILAAVDGCRGSPFHQGENKGPKVYDSIELICRDGEHVEAFMEHLRQRPKPKSLADDPDVQEFFRAGRGGKS